MLNPTFKPTSPVSPDLLARFAAIVGERYALSAPDAIAPYLTEERGLYQGRSPLVLRPGSVAEVSAILKLANETRTGIVPQGGNTGLVGGQTPHSGEIVLSLKRLDRVRVLQGGAAACQDGPRDNRNDRQGSEIHLTVLTWMKLGGSPATA